MKRILCLVLALVLVFLLCACGKSKEVKNVESMIDAIGVVTEYSEYQILAAESAYAALSPEDKQAVENYSALLNARAAYNAIPKTVDLTIGNLREYLEISFTYGDMEKYNVSGLIFEDQETIMNIYPVRTGTLENVELTLKIMPPVGYYYIDDDVVFLDSDDFQSEFTLDIRLPADGNYTDTFWIKNIFEFGRPGSSCKVQVVSVSGTFRESK